MNQLLFNTIDGTLADVWSTKCLNQPQPLVEEENPHKYVSLK